MALVGSGSDAIRRGRLGPRIGRATVTTAVAPATNGRVFVFPQPVFVTPNRCW